MQPQFDISIVTPSFNQGRFVEQCILSVLSQKDIRCQYIVIDAGSNDQTRKIIEAYEDDFDSLVVEPDEGQADALCKGFAYARADIVCYLNSDDYLLPGAARRACEVLKDNPHIDAVYSHRTYVDADDRFLRYWGLPAHSDRIHLRWDFIPQETCFWRRSAMERVGGIDSSFNFAMDYDLFARMMIQGFRFHRLNSFLAVFREHDSSKTTRLMDTVGTSEVERVQREQSIGIARGDRQALRRFYTELRLRSQWLRLRYPSGPPGFASRVRAGARAFSEKTRKPARSDA
jgi:glycosyltransferase involved in cell wall biosynthesis